MNPLIHHAHLYAIQHGATFKRVVHITTILAIALTAFLVSLMAIDIVLTHDASLDT